MGYLESPVPTGAACRSSGCTRPNRYKRLLCTVDLTKDFFFSYSYPVMRTLQKNLCDSQTGQVLYETMFVWNEFLTRGIRNRLKNNVWTVALVYGFFKQAKISVTDKDFWLTLIARRSRHYAGTRYLKRGVNDNGCVANDVETEQIVFEDVPTGTLTQISSIVQNRGSIPLLWSQETSKLNMKPDIILRKKDENFEATRLHFMNLVRRYGNPILILNLIKMREKKPRESILRAEFANAIDFLNKDLAEEDCLRFLHWNFHKHMRKHMRSKATNVLLLLGKIATYALHQTGFFYCQLTPVLGLNGVPKWPDATQHWLNWKLPLYTWNFFKLFQHFHSLLGDCSLPLLFLNWLILFSSFFNQGFLGYFRALQEKSTIWDLNSDRSCNSSWCDNSFLSATPSSSMKRSQSDGNILHQNNILVRLLCGNKRSPDVPCARRLSSSNTGTSTRQKDESYSRSTVANLSAENVISGLASDSSLPLSENDYGIKRTDDHATNNVLQNSDTLEEFSDRFVRWVNLGETLSLT
ncbi:hypothetical protein KFK09_029332 [Dendrobium nobile]|uniref:SAC domain-containing protein n=1 Tax=Dendrobium nobile TaxID=94219 RepID=A0A8T2ZZZ5_DENNO|nr:hypothetical protein KFK09_029332 [Dendrobium nobile]